MLSILVISKILLIALTFQSGQHLIKNFGIRWQLSHLARLVKLYLISRIMNHRC